MHNPVSTLRIRATTTESGAKAERKPLNAEQVEEKTETVAAARLLRLRDVCHRTGLSRTTIWRLEQRGAFPSHRQISPNAVGWLEREVTDWIESRVPHSCR